MHIGFTVFCNLYLPECKCCNYFENGLRRSYSGRFSTHSHEILSTITPNTCYPVWFQALQNFMFNRRFLLCVPACSHSLKVDYVRPGFEPGGRSGYVYIHEALAAIQRDDLSLMDWVDSTLRRGDAAGLKSMNQKIHTENSSDRTVSRYEKT